MINVYRLICSLTCRKYGPTYALADKNNNIITVWSKEDLYNLAQTHGISNATIRVTKSD